MSIQSKKESVRVSEAVKEEEAVNVENNTISADPVVIGGYTYAEPMREVRTINVSLETITVDKEGEKIVETNEVNSEPIISEEVTVEENVKHI